MRSIIKKILGTFLIPWGKWYSSKDRFYQYQQVKVKVFKGIFHPGLFFSTKLLLKYLPSLSLNNKRFLELGAGTGIISVFAAQQNAIVTASDINPKAIENIQYNNQQNQANIQVIQSDLFDQFTNQAFDYIVINPPYYPQNPQSDAEYAWYCGENFEYFSRLFQQLPAFLQPSGQVLMILSSDCAIERIRQIAQQHQLQWQEIKKFRVWWEDNYLFKITYNPVVNTL